MRRLKSLAASALLCVLMLVPALPVTAAPALFAASTSQGEACSAIGDISPGSGSCSNPSGSSVDSIIKLVIQILSILAGVIAVIMLMVAGLKYVTSQGDATQITSAKNSLLYAVIGLVVVAFAQFIVKFVLSKSV